MKTFTSECQKIKNLPPGKKLPYIWEYYKIHLILVLFAIFFFFYFLFPLFGKWRENAMLSIAIIDSTENAKVSTSQLEEDYLATLSGHTDHDRVLIDVSGSSSNTSSSSEIKLTILLSSVGENDLIICNQEVFDRFHKEGAFLDLTAYSTQLPDDAVVFSSVAIDLSSCAGWQQYGYTSYSPVYACIPVSCKHPEQALHFINFLYENASDS